MTFSCWENDKIATSGNSILVTQTLNSLTVSFGAVLLFIIGSTKSNVMDSAQEGWEMSELTIT